MKLGDVSTQYLEQCRTALQSEQTQSLATSNNWSHVDKPQVHLDWDVLYQELTPLLSTSTPTSDEVQMLMARHYAIAAENEFDWDEDARAEAREAIPRLMRLL